MLTRWQPFSDIRSDAHRMQREMSRLFGRYGDSFGESARSRYPLLNVWEDENSLFVEAELPGFKMEDIEIYVNGENQLSVKGERQRPELGTGSWQRQERGYGTFHRVFELPGTVDSDLVSATYTDGVLKVTLPKKEETKPRRIDVKPS